MIPPNDTRADGGGRAQAERHILITGGAGYIGSLLTQGLLRRGDWVTVVDKLLFGGESLIANLGDPKFHFLQADVCRAGVLNEAVQATAQAGAPPVSAVVHLAAVVGFPACQALDEATVWRTNVEAVRRIYEDADRMEAERMLFASTYSVYGTSRDGGMVDESSELNPQSLYGETKLAAEEALRQAGRSGTCAPLIFRFATLYGVSPRMRFDLILNQFVLEAFTRGELVLYQSDHSRSFVHIRDVLHGLFLGLDAPVEQVRGETLNLGDEGGNLTKLALVGLIQGALPDLRVQHRELSFSGDMRDLKVSFERIRRRLGFQATHTVPQGIAEVLALLRSGLIRDPLAPRYRNAPSLVS